MLNLLRLQTLRSHFSSTSNLPYSLHNDIANLLRIDFLRAIHITKTGHPTSCASIAEIMSVLFFSKYGLKFRADDVGDFGNDRLVLSKGHAAPILYAVLYRAGVITKEQLMSLRLKGSIFEGHPTPKIPFVDVASGSLGQGLSVAAGMAYSSKHLDSLSNRIYCITGDGELAEGNIWQAVDFARNHSLDNLTLFVDANRLGQSQETMHRHQVGTLGAKFGAFGWNVEYVDGHSVGELVGALERIGKQNGRPSVVVCKTFKGKNLGESIENREDWHGKDLGDKLTQSITYLKSIIKTKQTHFQTYIPSGPPISKQKGKISITPTYKPNQLISTRKAYGNALSKARKSNPNLLSLDCDTKNSTFASTLSRSHPSSFLQCHIAEQNMLGVAIGLACRGKIPFCSSFAAFLTRTYDQLRVAGIGRNAIKIVGTHAGCSVGEDGPSQMGLEDLGFVRNVQGGIVLVPSDGVAMERAVEIAGNYDGGPAYIRASRPDVPILYGNQEKFELGKCKVLKSSSTDKILVISHGTLVHQCLKAYNNLISQDLPIRILDIFSLKPLDTESILTHLQQCNGNLLVVEDHYQAGGAYEAVCAVAAGHVRKGRHLFVGSTPGSARPEEQLQMQGLDGKGIEKVIREQILE